MSKVGRKPIKLTSAKLQVQGNQITVTGPKGTMSHELPLAMELVINGNTVEIKPQEQARSSKALWGLHRALLANKVTGVEQGFEQVLKIVGLGFKAQLSGRNLVLTLGFSHKIDYALPAGVEVAIDKTGQILNVRCIDKSLLGKTCDSIRSFRPPEPYKGTGIMRAEEIVRRKAGKTKGS